ncbi:MAG: ribulokinase [Clostridiales bacterium]|nr:ribulokinase [Clostridiales bacterium]
MPKYCIGVDFGTLSARALVVEVGTGRELGSAVMNYPHAVMDEQLPDGTKLKPDWALQHPQDYLDCLARTVPEAIRLSGIDAADVVGVGIDFTACTMIAVDKDGVPLCFHDEYKSNPHAYIKLWKHHAAQDEANKLNEIAGERGEEWLRRYGGKISSEWMFPKIWQVLDEAPDIYDAADRFMEAADWVIMQLTGREARNSCTAGYKAIWHKRDGYPSKEFFGALDPRLTNVVDEKLSRDIYPIGSKAGEITFEAAKLTGLKPGTAVAVANVDAHVSLPPAGLTEAGKMLMIMGTSTCHIMLGSEEHIVPGMCGVVEDGVIPGLMGYEAGQSCVGDHFNWFVDNCVPIDYATEAAKRNTDLHQFLTGKAEKLKPGESGLLALDWWNGNRSVLVDVDLTGMMLGMTLTTKPEEMYRALIEATAYGTRIIIDTFEKSGVGIDELFACGGISKKNPFVMQVYADVLNREIRIARSLQTPALGSAMFGAVAASSQKGGYDSIVDAAREMGGVDELYYRPNPANVKVYEKLYREYVILHDYFGRGGNDVMKRLKDIKEEQRS